VELRSPLFCGRTWRGSNQPSLNNDIPLPPASVCLATSCCHLSIHAEVCFASCQGIRWLDPVRRSMSPACLRCVVPSVDPSGCGPSGLVAAHGFQRWTTRHCLGHLFRVAVGMAFSSCNLWIKSGLSIFLAPSQFIGNGLGFVDDICGNQSV